MKPAIISIHNLYTKFTRFLWVKHFSTSFNRMLGVIYDLLKILSVYKDVFRKCLTNDVGHILKNLLSWSDRPTLIDNKQTSGSQKLTDTGDKDHFCQVLKKLSSLIGTIL